MSNQRHRKRGMRTDSLADLLASAKCGDPDVIRHKASELGKDLNFEYRGGRTLLTKAIEDNEALSTVEAIIKAGANVDVQNMQGKTALMVAIRVRKPDVFKLLIESGANQDLMTHKNSSVFKQCLKEGLFSYLEILLKNVSEAVSICEKIHVMALFLKQREKKLTPKKRSHFRETDLGLKHGLIQAIKNSCNVNCTDETGTTPLMHAVKCHYDDCARLLLLAGADVNKINKKKETALIIAMTRGSSPVLPDLIMAGAFIKHPRSKTSSMHFEMFKKIIDSLQQNGILNMQDIHGKTALIYAAERGDRNCIMYAIEADVVEFVKIESLLEKNSSSVSCVHVCDDAGLFSSICKCKEIRCEDCDKYATEQMRKYKDKNGRPLLMYALETGRRLPDSYIQLRACDDAGYRDECGRTTLMNYFKFYQQNTGVYITQAVFNKAPPELLETLSSLKYALEISYKSIKKLFVGQVNIRDNEGNSTGIYAIKYYEFVTEEIVELLVGDTQKEQYEDGKTALMIALKDYKDHAVKYMKPLIGDSCNIQDKERKTALMYAITKPRGIPEPLIQQMIGDSQNIQDKDGKTALMYTMINSREIPDNLIKQMVGDSRKIQDNDGKTALMYAIINRRCQPDDLIKQIIGESQNIQDKDGKTALMHAFMYNVKLSEEMIEHLSQENPLIQDTFGKTALMYAFQFKRRLEYKTIDALFRGKVNMRDNEGYTHVIYALNFCTYLNEEIINLLVGDTQKNQYKDGKTALMIALENDKHSNSTYHYMQPLIGKSCTFQDNEGKTALMYAMKHERKLPDHLITMMISESQYIRDTEGKTALMYASQRSNFSNMLIINLFNRDLLNMQDNFGKTALHYAIEHNQNDEYLKHLILHGANLEIEDNNGCTALILCFALDILEVTSKYYCKDYFLKTKMFLQNYPILRLNQTGKSLLIFSVESGMFSLKDWYKNKELFRLMIANGVVPFPYSWSKFSALFAVLKIKLLDVAKYLIANVCLTIDDLKMLNIAKRFVNTNYNASNPRRDINFIGLDLSSPELQHLVMDVTSQPWPLVKLAFISVNSAFGHVVDREQRIQILPLPNPIKDMLMFNTRTALLPVSEWTNIPMVF